MEGERSVRSMRSIMSRRNSLIDPATIVASGPGLSGGKVGEECKFRIDGTDGGLALSFHIEGPSRPIFETMAGTDMSVDISYIPQLPGEYKLSLMWYGNHIEGSPFVFKIEGDGPEPTVEELVQRVKVSGRGLEFGRAQEYNEVFVDCRRVYLRDHKLRCSVKSPPKCSAMVKLNDNLDGTYSMSYKPTFAGAYLINVRIDDVHVPGSPFTAMIKGEVKCIERLQAMMDTMAKKSGASLCATEDGAMIAYIGSLMYESRHRPSNWEGNRQS